MIRRFMRFQAIAFLLIVASALHTQAGAQNRTRSGSSVSPTAAPADAGTRRAPSTGFIKEFGTMWTFDAPPLEYWNTTYNFTPDQQWLDNVRLSAVRLPNCSASIVSANGLVMTNHHCGRSCIASSSPADTNYLTTGFAARSMAEEKKCAGLYVDQLQSIRDVTERIQKATTATAAAKQVEQRNAEIGKIEQECSQTGLICQVVTFYQGGMYSLYAYRRYNDIRYVMSPEGHIAFYGGDPDNFTYPRYDLDVTFLRIYENGQPLKPSNYLRWSRAGATDGELAFVVGNPGSTGRMLTLAQMEFLRDVQYPYTLAYYRRLNGVYHTLSARSPQYERQFENAIFSIENSTKAVTGYRAGLLDSAIMAKKRSFETDFRARVNADPRLKAQYGNTWAEIERAQREMAGVFKDQQLVSFGGGSNLLNLAGGIVRLPVMTPLPDSARMMQYRGPGLERIRQVVLGAAPLDTAFERMTLVSTLKAWKESLPATDPVLKTALGYGNGDPEAAAARIIADTKLADPAVRKALLDGGTPAVTKSTDPLIVIARQIEPVNRRLTMRAMALDAVISANAEKLGQAIFAAYGRSLPPDATFTLRISDGVVKGFPYNGTVAPYKTTFYGLYDRWASFDNKPPFDLPQRWIDRKGQLDLSTPFDFVSTNDIIGGNSGSPVINRNAEVVGLIFDGNIESLPNRFIFTDEVARSVSVHSRALVEALRKVYDATWIADELERRTSP